MLDQIDTFEYKEMKPKFQENTKIIKERQKNQKKEIS